MREKESQLKVKDDKNIEGCFLGEWKEDDWVIDQVDPEDVF